MKIYERTYTVLTPNETVVSKVIDGPKTVALTFQGDNTLEVTDSHHTMEELYEHRHRLFLALVKIYDNYMTPMDCRIKCWKSDIHDDGSKYEGWFILGMTVTQPRMTFDPNEKDIIFDISYHLPMKYWHIANVRELAKAPPYDGYTSKNILERLMRL